LIAEIIRIFGPDLADKFLLVFGGTTIKVPSTKEMQQAKVNLAIYDTLKNVKSPVESRRLCALLQEQHNMKRADVRQAFYDTRKLMHEAKAYTEADARIGQHQKSRVKVKRKTKRRM
jgi:hypothetical protein